MSVANDQTPDGDDVEQPEIDKELTYCKDAVVDILGATVNLRERSIRFS